MSIRILVLATVVVMPMATTTIRVDGETHAKLVALSRESGRTLIETVRAATRALHRHTFVERVRTELDAMSADEWASYHAEIDSF